MRKEVDKLCKIRVKYICNAISNVNINAKKGEHYD